MADPRPLLDQLPVGFVRGLTSEEAFMLIHSPDAAATSADLEALARVAKAIGLTFEEASAALYLAAIRAARIPPPPP